MRVGQFNVFYKEIKRTYLTSVYNSIVCIMSNLWSERPGVQILAVAR